MARWSLAPKRSILVHFSWIYHQKSTFLLILAPFLSEAVEDSRCYFFEDWFMKLKIYNLLKPLGTITQQNYWSFYPSELIYFAFFTMRHPVGVDVFCYHEINKAPVNRLKFKPMQTVLCYNSKPISLLICTLRTTFLQPEKMWICSINPFYFLSVQSEKNPSLLNHFSVTLKITSKQGLS